MINKIRPQLIGVTDFASSKEVGQALKIFEKFLPLGLLLRMHVGVMTNRRMLNGEPGLYTNIWPKPQQFKKIFIEHPLVYNAVHYVGSVTDSGKFLNDLNRIVEYGGSNLNAIQLDTALPDVETLKEFRRNNPHVDIILQIGRSIFEEVKNEGKMVNKLKPYQDSVEYLLLDLSMGEGLPLNPKFLVPYVETLKIGLPNMMLIVAGGLGLEAANDSTAELFKRYPNIGVDAQRHMHIDSDPKKPLDMRNVENYLICMLTYLNKSTWINL